MDDMNPRAVMGGNNPPPYDPAVYMGYVAKVADFTDAAGDWLDLTEIQTEEQAQMATDFIAGARQLYKLIDEARKEAKAPHDAAGKAVQAAYTPLLDKVTLSASRVTALQTAWLKAERDRKQAEQARAAAEAKAAREEAERLAREAEARNDINGMVDAEAAIAEAAKAEKVAARKESVKAESATGGARSVGLRTYYECEIVSLNQAFMTFRDHPEVAATLVRIANAAVRAQKGQKTPPAGFTLIEKESAA